MNLSRQAILTVSSVETYELSDELINEFKSTLTGTDQAFAQDDDVTTQEFVLEMADELFDWLEKQRAEDNPKIEYSETEDVLSGEFNGITFNEED